MELEFHGAAGEVTGSCHILRVGGRTVLLDCGLFQGRRAESRTKNARLPVPVEQIDAVVLSHAHIDHAGRLPFLVAQGYRGPIYATPATRDLCGIMLADSAHIQEKDAEFLVRRGKPAVPPLYGRADAARTLEQMIGMPLGRTFEVVPGVRARFSEAGHILGSASVSLDCVAGDRTHRLLFSGDVGRWGLPIIRDPDPPHGAETVVMESTYGNRDHPPAEAMRERLGAIVRETAAAGGRVIVPAFAVGRTQEIIYDLHLLARQGAIPPVPVYVDSPLAINATGIFAAHPDLFDTSEELAALTREPFSFDRVHYVREVRDSKALNAQPGPMIVVAASGMAETGRVLHHLAHHAGDPRTTILIVGYQAEHTLGRRIVERRPVLRIFGDDVPLRARVEVLNGYSAHADRTELRRWLDAVRGDGPAPRVRLVHGEGEAQTALVEALRTAGYGDVAAPAPGERLPL